jgi:hypothetical protein
MDWCNECRARRFPDNSKQLSEEELPTERLLERLQAMEETLRGKGNQLQIAVDLLRSSKESWPKSERRWAPTRVGAVYLSDPRERPARREARERRI